MQSKGEHNKDRPRENGERAKERAGKSEGARQDRNWQQKNAIDQDLPRCRNRSGNHRQHRNSGTGVFIGTSKRQRPEMRRRPKEDNKKQDERLRRDLAGCGGPANYGWKCTPSASDDNVLWRLPLQPHRVHDDIKEDRKGEQRGGVDIERKSQDDDGAAGKNESEYKRFGARDLPARNWTTGGAGHQGVDVGVTPHIEHTSRASSGGDGENCSGPKKGIKATWCNHQTNHGSEYRQHHHTRLHQSDEIGQARTETRM